MIVLNENIDDIQRHQLAEWRIRANRIGDELGRAGMPDCEIIPLLHKLDHPTFFTRDHDFRDSRLCHSGYCVVFLDVYDAVVADTIRRVLKHSEFDTQAKRLGAVLDVSKSEIIVWRLPQRQMQRTAWVGH